MSTRTRQIRESVAATSARFEARARAARRRDRRPFVVAAAALAVLLVLGLLVWFGPLFTVRTIAVSGVSGQQAVQVREVVQPVSGSPLARLDTGSVRRRVGELIFVGGVQVSRGWPSTVRVVVQPRVAVAAVPVAGGGGFHLVDRAGVAYARVGKAPAGVPVVTVPLSAGVQGKDVQGTGGGGSADVSSEAELTLHATLSVLNGLPSSLRSKISQISASTPDDVRMKLGKATVVWGSADDTAFKARVLVALTKQKASVYDVSSPHNPVVR